MNYLLYLMFRCNFDVMESLDVGRIFVGSKHTPCVGMMGKRVRESDTSITETLCRHCSNHGSALPAVNSLVYGRLIIS